MKEIKHYVLGTKDSPLLKEYTEKYYVLLLSKLKDLIERGIMVDEIQQLLHNNEKKEFVLNPEISAIINLLHKPHITGEVDIDYDGAVLHFQKEITYFLEGNIEKMSMNQGNKIPDTDIRLTVFDKNPYNGVEAHPDHQFTGGFIGWGSNTESEWLESYKKTFDLLKVVDEGTYDELNQIIKKIVPLGTSEGVHNSSSYTECVGHLYLGFALGTKKPEFANLEAIIHESSHNKLNLLFHFDKIILHERIEKYYSPFRPDARPMHGVFLALHAFVPTIYIMMKAYKQGFLDGGSIGIEKIVLYYIKNKITLNVVKKHAKLTNMGLEILDEIIYIMGVTDKIFQSLHLSNELIREVYNEEKKHFHLVNLNYPKLEY